METTVPAASVTGFELSPQQLHIWSLHRSGARELGTSRCRVRIAGPLEAERLGAALEAVVARHEILRTAFQVLPGMSIPLQVVLPESSPELVSLDLGSQGRAAQEAELARFWAGFPAPELDLARGPFLRALLVRRSATLHVLLLTLPVLHGDGIGLDNLVREIAEAYAARRGAGVRPAPIQYVDVAEVLNDLLRSPETEEGRAYWRRRSELLRPPALPCELQVSGEAPFRPASWTRTVGSTGCAEPDAREPDARESDAGLWLACWQILLSRHAGQAEIVLGLALDGRTYEGLDRALGFFARHVPFSCGPLDEDMTVRGLMTRIERALEEVTEWQDFFSWEGAGREDGEGARGAFPRYTFASEPRAERISGGGLDFTIEGQELCGERFQLGLIRVDDGRIARFEYDPRRFRRTDVGLMADRFAALLAASKRDPDVRLGQLEVLGRTERHRLLYELNDTASAVSGKGLHQHFEDQVAKTPERIAAVLGGDHQTYGELDRRAQRLARTLRRAGVGPEVRVALYVERSPGMLVGMLAVLKAGGAYLPLDPSYPEARLAAWLEDGATPVLLTEERLLGTLPGGAGTSGRTRVLCVDRDDLGGSTSAAEPSRSAARPEQLAYTIYTSGSTGRPKGVMVSHGAIVNRLRWMERRFPLRATDRVLQKTAYSFDASIWEIFEPLLAGACVVLCRPGAHRDGAEILAAVAAERVTVLQLVPSMLSVFTGLDGAAEGSRSLRRLFCGGEVLAGELAARTAGLLDVEVCNFYGPTESAIDASFHPGSTAGSEHGSVPIGRPVDNVEIHLSDPRLRAVPGSFPGELCIAGSSLARGYRGRPGSTAERFVPHPFGARPGERLYRTGDLARRLPAGELEFLGRGDRQVKLRGFRIELGEIEAVLSGHPDVREAAATVHGEAGGREQRLLAWVVPRAGVELVGADAPAGSGDRRPPAVTAAELRDHLAARLPEHMLPAAFLPLEALPRLPNGKLDRKAFPDPDAVAAGPKTSHVAPRTPLERALAEIWTEALNVERLGVRDNFFDLGGNSLVATAVVSRIWKDLEVQLAIRELFVYPTVELLAARVGEAVPGVRTSRRASERAIPRRRREGPVPLSFAQQRLWFLDRMVATPAYHLPSAIYLRGPIDVAALARSLTEVVRRHENLRSRFVDDGDRPVRILAPPAAVELPVVDLRALPEGDAGKVARALAREEARRPFDLTADLLLRARLLRRGREEHLLLFTLHHIVSDGWSNGVLTREIGALYRAFSAGRPSPLADLPIQYADYAVWQREWLQGETLEAQLDFWRRQLADPPVLLELPADRRRPAIQSFRGSVLRFSLDRDLVTRLEELGRRADATPFMVLLAGFQTLMARLSGQDDVLVGTPVANRTRPELEGLIGFFVNTLVLRADLSADPSPRGLLAQVRERTLAAYDHQELPFERLVEELGLERSLRHAPLFQVVFAFQNVPPSDPRALGESVLTEPLMLETGTAKFDLTLAMNPVEGRLEGRLEYSSDLFDRTTVQRWMRHFETLLGAIADDPEAGVRSLPIFRAGERHQLVAEWNGARQPATGGPCLHELFRARAASAPEAVAVVSEGSQLSYRELGRRARELAGVLRAQGLRTGERVGVLAERGPELVVALLGVLEAGGAYVPLDPAYPEERLAFQLEDVGASLLVVATDRVATDRVADFGKLGPRTIFLDRGTPGGHPDRGSAPRGSPVRVSDLSPAYVIYTSGSTGRPKGVAVSHRNVTRLFSASERWFAFDERDVWTLFHSYAFDFSVWEIWGALLSGGRLVVVPYRVSRSPGAFRRLLAAERITVLNQTPSAFGALISAESEGPASRSPALHLRRVVFGGETLEPGRLAPWFARHPDRPVLVNMYGITETTVHVTCRTLSGSDAGGTAGSAIGRPLPDLALHVLDPRLELQPIGVAGELCVAGAGLAQGYLRRPALTAERFVPDPFGARAGGRLYRSGDLGRALPAGDLEYLGRRDHQVKIRGFRIEPGEIGAALAGHPAVREAVVRAVPSDDVDRRSGARLVAWVVPDPELAPSPDDLRSALRRRLPEHMIPSAFVLLDALPLTPQGKIDRAALPAPGPERPELETAYAPPANEIEEILAGVFSQATGVEEVGAHDNFFALGGDSIRSVRAVALARERGLDVSLQQLFQVQTVRELARHVESRGGIDGGSEPAAELRPTAPFELVAPEDRALLPEDVEDAYPLTMLQAGMLYHMELDPGSAFYHNVNSYHLRSVFEGKAFQRAVDRVVARHAVLRTSFDLTSYGEPLQRVHREARLPVSVADLRGLPGDRQEAAIDRYIEQEIARPFDVLRPPLLRFLVHLRTAETFQFTLTEAHPIFDGWSLQSTLHEIFREYCVFLRGEAPPPRPPPPVAFRDFVALERRVVESEGARDFWGQKLAGGRPTRLPRWYSSADRVFRQQVSRRHLPRTRRHYLRVEISEGVSDGLKRLARSAAVPVKSVLLAAHLEVLSWLTSSDEVLTGLSSHGRPETLGGEDARGLFLNTLPFRYRLQRIPWADLVRDVFAAERELLPHRRYPLPAIQKLQGEEPLFETLFNYVHFHVLDDIGELLEIESLGFKKFERTSIPFLAGFRQDVSTGGLGLELAFHPERLSREEVLVFAGYYQRLLGVVAEDPGRSRGDLSLLSEAQRHQILREWNDSHRRRREELFARVFAARVERHPEAVAVVRDSSQLTYRELGRRAHQLARRLIALGAGRGARVALLSEHSLESVIATLAILESGAAYVPLDPGYPPRHSRYVVEDAEVRVLVGRKGALDELDAGGVATLCLDGPSWPAAGESPEAPAVRLDGRDAAYVIYTSGSTGEPKGVEVDQRALCDYALWARERYGGGGLRFALFSSPAFDLTWTSIVAPLSSGGRIVVYPGTSAESAIVEVFRDRRTEVVKLTPSHMQLLDDDDLRGAVVRRLIVGGEDLTADLARRTAGRFEGAVEILNEYGPTEATVGCLLHRFRPAVDRRPSVPVGMPAANARISVLDRSLRLVPAGAAGEICIAGDGLARGYLKRPGPTAASFVPDPFARGGRIYRSGDLGRRLPSGAVEFLGRRDKQVKFHGYRVELAGLGAALEEHPGVRQSVVVVSPREGGDVLAAYYVSRQPLPVAELRAFLGERLVAATVPSVFVHLRRLPLNLRGKVDESALPPVSPETRGGSAYAAPRTVTEEVLAAIWSRVLNAERVGVDDGFFDLGGHSLVAARLIAGVRGAFGVTLPLRTVLDASTVAGMAVAIERARRGGRTGRTPDRPALEALPRAAADAGAGWPLSFAQQRMWLAYQVDPSKVTYNVPAAVRFSGRLDPGALEASLSQIVARHETLRTVFVETDEGCRQVIVPPRCWRLPVRDLSRLAGEAQERELRRWLDREANRPFDLERGPLMRAHLFVLGGGEHVLLVNLHHIVTDGWSMELLLREAMTLYEAAVDGRPSPLAELPVQYVDFAVWQRRVLTDERLADQLSYWRRQLRGAPAELGFPADHPRPERPRYRGETRSELLPGELARSLEELARGEHVTLFMTLLAAFAVLFHQRTGGVDLVIGTISAGRTRSEIQPLIGCFVHQLALRMDLSGDPAFRELLGRARDVYLEADLHQELPIEEIVEDLGFERGVGRNPLSRVQLVLDQHLPLPVREELEVRPMPWKSRTAKLDLIVACTSRPDGLRVAMEYDSDLFKASTIADLTADFGNLLERVCEAPEATVGELVERVRDAGSRRQEAAAQRLRGVGSELLKRVARQSALAREAAGGGRAESAGG